MKYIIKKEYTLEEILPKIKDENKIHIDGMIIPVDKEKMKTFFKSTTCISCGIESTHFSLEKIPNCTHGIYGNYHFNLYAKRNNDKVLMTVDHIILKKKGGPNVSSNYNTMCTTCNARRGDKYEVLEDFLKFSKLNPLNSHLQKQKEQKILREIYKNTVQAAHVVEYYKGRKKVLANLKNT